MNQTTKILLLISLVLLLPFSVSALEIAVNSTNLRKGEQLVIDGNTDGDVVITITAGNKKVFRKKIEVKNNSFSFSYDIAILDPQGMWNIEVEDSRKTVNRQIWVKPSRESEFLNIRFLSPTPTKHYRTSVIDVAVKITDAKQPVIGAMVYFWDVKGNKIKLLGSKDGTYSKKYEIPKDVKPGKWTIKVVAKAFSVDYGWVGGENDLELTIEPSPINIELIEPKTTSYQSGEDIPLKIRLTYVEGRPVIGADAYAVINYESIDLEETSPGVYEGGYYPRELKSDLISIYFTAKDKFDNKGKKTITLKPTGYLFSLFKNNAIFYVFPILFILYILYLSTKELRIFTSTSSLRRKKQEILRMKKKLQEDFYLRHLITERTYKERNAKYNTLLEGIESQLRRVQEKTHASS